MLPKELEDFIHAGAVDRVTISRPSPESAWSIHAYGDALPSATVNQIVLNEQGSKRLWSDLTAAYQFIRKSGFRHSIEVDG